MDDLLAKTKTQWSKKLTHKTKNVKETKQLLQHHNQVKKEMNDLRHSKARKIATSEGLRLKTYQQQLREKQAHNA